MLTESATDGWAIQLAFLLWLQPRVLRDSFFDVYFLAMPVHGGLEDTSLLGRDRSAFLP